MPRIKQVFNFIIIVFCFLSSLAQSGVINGALIAETPSEKQQIMEKTKVILNIRGDEKTVSIDKNLKFSFQNLSSDTIQIRTEPPSFSQNRIIIGFLKPDETLVLKIPYSLTCKYDKSKNNKTCPICKKEDNTIPIVYGLIININKDETEYHLGVVQLPNVIQIGTVKEMILNFNKV
ncbi:hypothetical protein [Aquimarina sediminis]|uniref:hypothetical protein n=1 Tax=Aquimarina sediminis TaxID=2070536 RepID=UPI000CA05695|nr:hypothetical protein [Aquimarina sediminis]